ncbi:MAG: ASPIC/UnbV domain-containing protein [Planctomycetaceae bacterium]
MSHSPIDADPDQQHDGYVLGWQQMTQRIEDGGSWSGRERNCCFLNTGTSGFADISAVTGLDFEDDGRTVAATDWDHDGDLDIWLSGRTAPRLRFMRNNSSGTARYLNVRLEGQRCNRDAVGARVELHLAGPAPRTLFKTLRAGDAFLSQSSNWIHFGLGDTAEIEKLVVYWPGGNGQTDRVPQVVRGLACNSWYRIVQNVDDPEFWSPPRRTVDLAVAPLTAPSDDEPERVVLLNRVPLPELTCTGTDHQTMPVAEGRSGPTLINLWATWCAPCLEELGQFALKHDQIRAAGLDLMAINVDGMADDGPLDSSRPEAVLQKLKFPFTAGFATRDAFDRLDVIHDTVLLLRANRDDSLSLPVPVSFLVDRQNRLAVIYRGAVSVDRLLSDAARLDSAEFPLSGVPFSGKWFLRPGGACTFFARFADRFGRRGYLREADQFASLAADLSSREGAAHEVTDQLVSVFSNLGDISRTQGNPDDAIRQYRRVLSLSPQQSGIQLELGRLLASQSRIEEAIENLSNAVRLDPQDDEARRTLDAVRSRLNR